MNRPGLEETENRRSCFCCLLLSSLLPSASPGSPNIHGPKPSPWFPPFPCPLPLLRQFEQPGELVTLPSGLQYREMEVGTGHRTAEIGSTVEISYIVYRLSSGAYFKVRPGRAGGGERGECEGQ